MDLDLTVLLPHLTEVELEQVEVVEDRVVIHAAPKATSANCPSCAVATQRVHDRYVRRLTDVALGGRKVLIRVRVRRFICASAACPARTFVEQISGLTSRYARRSPPLRTMLEAIGLALCARAGARLAARLGVAASRSGLLRLLRAMPDPSSRTAASTPFPASRCRTCFWRLPPDQSRYGPPSVSSSAESSVSVK
ncbi:transposase family protein [Actinoplanes xinjiangensis]|uniref:transposase family protein n=1 Tax=Actinoplanes xinjiangensis TaxID=512350 RepID=UPI00344AEDDB